MKKKQSFRYSKEQLLYLSLRITVPKVSKLRLIWQPSFSLCPTDNAWAARSLPARSTKFCRKFELAGHNIVLAIEFQKCLCREHTLHLHFYIHKINNQKESQLIHTTLAARVADLPFPTNSRAELSIVCNTQIKCIRKYFIHDNCIKSTNQKKQEKLKADQSKNLMRSRACFIQGSLPYLSLSCKNIIKYIKTSHSR